MTARTCPPQDVLAKLRIKKANKHSFTLLDDVNGIIHPSRICLLLGPPGSGKSTLLQALAGKLEGAGGMEVRAASFLPLMYIYESRM